MNSIRFTRGVTESGVTFEFHDDWTKADNSHRLLDERWVGCTIFVEKTKETLSCLQDTEKNVQAAKKRALCDAFDRVFARRSFLVH